MDAAQLAEVERLCQIVITNSPASQFAAAQEQLLPLGTSVEHMDLLQAIFAGSTNSYAITVAAQSLTQLVNNYWNSFSEGQRTEIREAHAVRIGGEGEGAGQCMSRDPVRPPAGDYLLAFLVEKGPQLEEWAVALVRGTICRMTKFGWFDAGDGMKRLVEETSKMVQMTVAHSIIGLSLLIDCVSEMNHKNKNRTMTQHRKVAVSFRDHSLFSCFEVSLSMLHQVATRMIDLSALPPAEAERMEDRILHHSLTLLVGCLSFDFVGTSPEDDSDPTALQVPGTWRDRIQNGATLRLLFNLYKGCTTGAISIIPDAAPPPLAAAAGSGPAGAGSKGGGGGPFSKKGAACVMVAAWARHVPAHVLHLLHLPSTPPPPPPPACRSPRECHVCRRVWGGVWRSAICVHGGHGRRRHAAHARVIVARRVG